VSSRTILSDDEITALEAIERQGVWARQLAAEAASAMSRIAEAVVMGRELDYRRKEADRAHKRLNDAIDELDRLRTNARALGVYANKIEAASTGKKWHE
jgi:hypothetical protein